MFFEENSIDVKCLTKSVRAHEIQRKTDQKAVGSIGSVGIRRTWRCVLWCNDVDRLGVFADSSLSFSYQMANLDSRLFFDRLFVDLGGTLYS